MLSKVANVTLKIIWPHYILTIINCDILFISNFSFVRNGLGLGLTSFAILLLSLLHHVNLRTIKEPPKTNYPPYLTYLKPETLKLTIFFMFMIFFLCITMLFSFIFTWNIYVLHIRSILIFLFAFIIIPKYFINQNKNLKLYVSVYHWVPAPLLPWQLPKNFNPNSVNLICVHHPNNE